MKILNHEKRSAMFTIYAFCKEIDNIGDSFIEKKEKKKKLNNWKKEIKQIFKKKTNNNLIKSLEKYIKKYKLKKNLLLEIIKGVEMDINNRMIVPKKKIFDLYCYRVAGVVGLLCLCIYQENNKNSRSFALKLAKAFQITNILRDIKEDASMGRLYMPKEILTNLGIKEKSINQIINNQKFYIACRKLSNLAELNFKMAEKELKLCSKNKLKSAILMMLTYKLLLKKLKKRDWESIEKKIKLSIIEKITLFLKVLIY